MKVRHRTSLAAACGSLSLLATNVHAAADVKDPFDFFISDEYSYDDNLFRIPENLSLLDPTQVDVEALPGRSEDDYINRVSAGVDVRTDVGRQVFNFGLKFSDVRYQKNDDLNYRGGAANLNWDWQLGSRLEGRLSGLYDRSQASFANYLLFDRDVVETQAYGLDLRYRIGSRFALAAGGGLASGDHSLAARRDQNFDGETARFGLEYRTPSNNLLALDYRSTHVEFDNLPDLPGVIGRDYDEDSPTVIAKYAFTVKTSLEVRAGYIDRDYIDPAARDYSGETWNVAVRWEPRITLLFDIKAAHELRSYSDAETDYFEADVFSIGPTWKPLEQLKLTTAFSWEDQDYIANGLPQLEGPRKDEVRAVKVALDYTPRDMVALGLTYQFIERESNRELREYDNALVGCQLKVTF